MTSRVLELYRELETIMKSRDPTGVPEGNCYYKDKTWETDAALEAKRLNMYELAMAIGNAPRAGAARILEIGFNAGHSAAIWLLGAGARAEYTFIDLGDHTYTVPCYDHLRSRFLALPMQLLRGDSRWILPQHVRDAKGPYDLIHIDGGHSSSCFFSDLACAIALGRRGTVILVDDIQVDFIHQWIDHLIANKVVEHVRLRETPLYPHCAVRLL
jgi:predicted O-methyltransferase YrrM